MKKQLVFIFTALCCMQAFSQKSGIQKQYMDLKVSPQQDFYGYCNGTWQRQFVLPESDARYGSFNSINDDNLKRIKKILDPLQQSDGKSLDETSKRIASFYSIAMDSVLANRLDQNPILGLLKSIDMCAGISEVLNLKSEFDYAGISTWFSMGVSANLKQSKRNSLYLNQGGYGMGDRDYYHEKRFDDIRIAYLAYLKSLFMAIGLDSSMALQNAQNCIAVETQLTDKALTRLEMRDIEKQYNPITVSNLKSWHSSFNWTAYFKTFALSETDTLIVNNINYFKNLQQIWQSVSLDVLKSYLKAQLLMESAPYLSERFIKIHFDFRGRVLSGAKQMKPRWQRVYQLMNGTMGELVAQKYVMAYFPKSSKDKVQSMIDYLIAAYRKRIDSRTWMSAETKIQAQRKLDLLIRKVGYPEVWKTYKGLEFASESYWDNIKRLNRYLIIDNISELKKPVDRNKWQMTPTTVNAYYDPTTNEITFPAAILQPPFFDPEADDAANFGTMGAIIGHELTHGFDDQGAQFDAEGNLKMWWTSADFNEFSNRKAGIIDQFNAFVAIDTLHVNGAMTQGENIADLGGLTMAYDAYHLKLGKTAPKVIDGFTADQRFFIAWAQGWKAKTRDAELKRLLTLDYHAPAYYRAFAPLTNLPAFYKAFHVKPGDAMYRDEKQRVEVW